MTIYTSRRAKAAGLVALLFLLGELLFQDFLLSVAKVASSVLASLVTRPMGYGFLLLIVLVAVPFWVVLVQEWRASRRPGTPPTAKPVAPVPRRQLTDAEHRAIDEIRVFWRTYAKNAVDELLVTTFDVMNALVGSNRFISLVSQPKYELEKTRDTLNGALLDHSLKNIPEIDDDCGAMFQDYMYLLKWVHHCKRLYPVVFQVLPVAERYGRWRAAHDGMRAKLLELSKRAALSCFESHYSHTEPDDELFPYDRPIASDGANG